MPLSNLKFDKRMADNVLSTESRDCFVYKYTGIYMCIYYVYLTGKILSYQFEL